MGDTISTGIEQAVTGLNLAIKEDFEDTGGGALVCERTTVGVDHACPTPVSPTPCANCPTPTPTPTPTPIPTPTPTPVQPGPTPIPETVLAALPSQGSQLDGKVQLTFAADASLTIKTGTQTAVDEWNRATPWSPEGGNIEFCHRSGDTTAPPSSTICTPLGRPNQSVDDGRTVTIRTTHGVTGDHCTGTRSLACIKPTFERGQRIENQTIYIKDPAVIPVCVRQFVDRLV